MNLVDTRNQLPDLAAVLEAGMGRVAPTFPPNCYRQEHYAKPEILNLPHYVFAFSDSWSARLVFADFSCSSRSAEEGRDEKKFPAFDGGGEMIFINFWTLNTDLPPSKIAEAAAKLMEKEKFPLKGVKMLGFYVCPGGRGITINEMEDAAAASETAFEDYVMWLKEVPGLFTSWETLPAVPAEKGISIVLK